MIRKDYVHEKKAGEGVLVYVIDHGVNVDVKDVGKLISLEHDLLTVNRTKEKECLRPPATLEAISILSSPDTGAIKVRHITTRE